MLSNRDRDRNRVKSALKRSPKQRGILLALPCVELLLSERRCAVGCAFCASTCSSSRAGASELSGPGAVNAEAAEEATRIVSGAASSNAPSGYPVPWRARGSEGSKPGTASGNESGPGPVGDSSMRRSGVDCSRVAFPDTMADALRGGGGVRNAHTSHTVERTSAKKAVRSSAASIAYYAMAARCVSLANACANRVWFR